MEGTLCTAPQPNCRQIASWPIVGGINEGLAQSEASIRRETCCVHQSLAAGLEGGTMNLVWQMFDSRSEHSFRSLLYLPTIVWRASLLYPPQRLMFSLGDWRLFDSLGLSRATCQPLHPRTKCTQGPRRRWQEWGGENHAPDVKLPASAASWGHSQ